MGGCAASKMPTGDQDAARKTSSSSRFGYSSSSSSPRKASLNASENRIKHLAATDDTYGLVQGGKPALVVPETNGHAVLDAVLDVMRDVGSQTHSSSSSAPDIKVSRPSQFPAFSPKLGSNRLTAAPLATMETASELGTPTPMEENKSFSRSGSSLLPLPGRSRPLPSLPAYNSGFTPGRYAFAPPGAQSFPSPSPTLPAPGCAFSPLSGQTTPTLKQPRQAIPPRLPPPTSLIAPSPAPRGGATVTDNVMITTGSPAFGSTFGAGIKTLSGSVSNGGSGLVRPGGSMSSVRSGSGGNESLERVRASSSVASGGLKQPVGMPNGSAVSGLPRRSTDNDHVREPLSADHTGLMKPSIPAPGGLRQPKPTSTSARGPLAGQQAFKPASLLPTYVPPKPIRKSSQSQPGVTAASLLQSLSSAREDFLLTGSQSSHLGHPERVIQEKTAPPKGILTNRSATKFSSDELDNNESDTTDRGDDDSIFSEREGLAETPRTYKVSEAAIESMMVSLRDVKNMAHELQQLHDSTKTLLQNGHDTMTARVGTTNGTGAMSYIKSDKLDFLLQHPDEKTLNDPTAALKLILELQTAVRALMA